MALDFSKVHMSQKLGTVQSAGSKLVAYYVVGCAHLTNLVQEML